MKKTLNIALIYSFLKKIMRTVIYSINQSTSYSVLPMKIKSVPRKKFFSMPLLHVSESIDGFKRFSMFSQSVEELTEEKNVLRLRFEDSLINGLFCLYTSTFLFLFLQERVHQCLYKSYQDPELFFHGCRTKASD